MSSTTSSAATETSPAALERRGGSETRPEPFLDLIQGLDAIVWEMDMASSSFTFVSERAEAILGYSVQLWLEDPTFWQMRVVHPEDQEWAVDFCARATQERRDHEFEYRALRADGQVVWLRDLVRVARDESGQAGRLRGVMIDITREMQAREKLHESEAKLVEAHVLAGIGSWQWDPKTDQVTWSDSLFRVYGREPLRRSMPVAAFLDFIHPDDRQVVRDAVAEAWERGGTFEHFHRALCPDGSIRWIHGRGEVVLDATGSPARVIGTGQDITAQREAEEALRRANEELEQRVAERTAELAAANEALLGRTQELEAIFQALPDLYFRLSADGTILEKRARRDQGGRYHLAVDGFTENMVGLNALDVLHGDAAAALREALVEVPRTGEMVCFEFTVPVGGSTRHNEARVLPLVDGELVVIVRDITDRKRNERELQRRRAEAERVADALRFQRTLLEAQDRAGIDGILVAHEGRVLRMNRRYADLFRVPQELRAPERCAEMFSWACQQAADPDAYRATIDQLRYDPDATRRDEVLLADGRVLDRYTAPLKSAEGHLYGRLWMLRDITARKQAEQALQEREEQFRRLIENSSDYIMIVDSSAAITYVGPSAERLLGYTPEEMIGKRPVDMVHPDDVPQVMATLQDIVTYPGEARLAEFRIRHKDGSWRVFENLGKTLSPHSADEGVVANGRDITERKRAEAELIRQKAYFEGIIDSLDAGVAVFDRTGRFEYVSRTAVSDAELRRWIIGKTNEDYSRRRGIPPEISEQRQRSLDRALAEGKPNEFEQEMRRPDGSTRHMLRRVLPLLDEAGEVERVIGYSVDITERKQAEEKLRQATEVAEQARQEAERANRAKSEFLSRMSHELRTPMNSILGFAQLLERSELSPKHTKSVQHILKAGRHLLHLINEVLEIARIEAGRQNFSLEPVRIGPVLQEAIGLVRPLAAQWNVELDDEPGADADLFVRADRQRLVQVLLNLLSNAIKYNRPAGRVRLSCVAAGEPGRLAVRVEDTGRGIPEDKADELFTPFSRLGAEQTDVEGTGLGLALSQRLAEAMGGDLWLERSSDAGSVFRLDLVSAEDPVARLDAPETPGAVLESAAHREATLLYIEDNLANLSLVETILLSRPQWRTVPALQGQLGLELAREHLPDLILLDLHLPDINGEEVLRRLRADARTATIPVVIVSADATRSSVERLRSAGADAYLTKPLDIDEFLETVGRFLPENDG
ncbi:MAG TPA: PAS domain S-box protein [Longimicrobiaceae bacterium]|nr:PAS domain S-box protein [Longimicrobiaceae bacterium]